MSGPPCEITAAGSEKKFFVAIESRKSPASALSLRGAGQPQLTHGRLCLPEHRRTGFTMKEDDYVRLELFLEGMERIKDFCEGVEAWMSELEQRLSKLEERSDDDLK